MRKKVKIRLFSETASISNTELGQNQAFSETASVTNAELGHNWAIFLNRILFKCVNGSKSVNSPILTSVHIYNGCDFSKKPDFDPFPHLKWMRFQLIAQFGPHSEFIKDAVSVKSPILTQVRI